MKRNLYFKIITIFLVVFMIGQGIAYIPDAEAKRKRSDAVRRSEAAEARAVIKEFEKGLSDFGLSVDVSSEVLTHAC